MFDFNFKLKANVKDRVSVKNVKAIKIWEPATVICIDIRLYPDAIVKPIYRVQLDRTNSNGNPIFLNLSCGEVKKIDLEPTK